MTFGKTLKCSKCKTDIGVLETLEFEKNTTEGGWDFYLEFTPVERNWTADWPVDDSGLLSFSKTGNHSGSTWWISGNINFNEHYERKIDWWICF